MLKHCSRSSLNVQTCQANDSKTYKPKEHMFGQNQKKTVTEILSLDTLGKRLSVSLMFIDQERSMIAY